MCEVPWIDVKEEPVSYILFMNNQFIIYVYKMDVVLYWLGASMPIRLEDCFNYSPKFHFKGFN